MKKTNLIAIAAFAAVTVLASGCGSKDAPFTIDAGERSSSGDTTVTPVDSKTDGEGTTAAGDETIAPTTEARPEVVVETPPTPAPSETTPSAPTPPTAESPAVTDGDGVADDAPEIGTPPLPSVTVTFPAPGVLIPLPRGVLRNPEITLVSQHDRDLAHLMNDTFQPGEFTAYELEARERVIAERTAIADADFANTLKDYVTSVLRALIDAERNNADIFRQRTAKLGDVIAAFKSGELLTAMNSVYEGALADRALWSAAARHPELLKQAGSYLEIQFAEAMKDFAKASFDARQEVREQSSLVQGGEGLFLVYKPDGIADSGWNHIRSFDFADFWYEGSSNWRGLAEGLRGALNAELHPIDAAAAARSIENLSGQMRERGESISEAMGRW